VRLPRAPSFTVGAHSKTFIEMREDIRNPLHVFSPSSYQPYRKMTDYDSPSTTAPKPRKRGFPFILYASYITDWLCLIAAGVVGTILGNVTPNKRPFRIDDPNIGYVSHESSANQ
jgi:hypothetical protein